MSLSKSDIKLIKSLHQKKFRNEYRQFIVEGEKCVNELLHSDYEIIHLYHTHEWENKSNNIQKTPVSINELQRLSTLNTANKVLALVKQKDTTFIKYVDEKISLCLYDIKDPGNLGTIIRVADWFGIKNIYLSENSVEVYNPKCVQASMGSLFRVNCRYGAVENIFSDAKKNQSKVVAATLEGINLYQYRKPEKTLLVMGSESHGLSPDILNLCDEQITIPSYGQAESLNVAIATGIICAEWMKG
jgi:TrmH family RNA methyltransferase